MTQNCLWCRKSIADGTGLPSLTNQPSVYHAVCASEMQAPIDAARLLDADRQTETRHEELQLAHVVRNTSRPTPPMPTPSDPLFIGFFNHGLTIPLPEASNWLPPNDA
jgi:hypothetical protein